jgi:phosphohistidine swiveling domain-containing protein
MGRRFLRLFYGRCALSVRTISVVGDRIPGTTGPAAVESLFGRVPDDMVFSPTRRHYPQVVTRLPRIYRATPRNLEAAAPESAAWWRESTDRVSGLDRNGATALLKEAFQRFHEALLLQHLAVLGVVQPSLAMLDLVARRTGVPEVNDLGTASGNAEMAVVCDLWRTSRGRIRVDQVVAIHGFHAPLEGELSTRVWREDDLALRRMVEQYSLLGELLAAEGLIERTDDVFYLTMTELTGTLPADARALISGRRARRAEYQQVTIPGDWQGMPPTQPLQTDEDAPEVDRVTGIGVSPGVVEGRVRVVTEPDFTVIEPGEILVSTTTDPSWSSIMFLSAALVVDIGGLLSHAAVVAREMGVPCVANTRSGTRSLRTGDLVRVDGGSGIVVVLERARADT